MDAIGRTAPPTVAKTRPRCWPVRARPKPSRQALELTKQARAALAAGQIDLAEQLARQAEALKVPSNAFGPQDDRPALVILEVAKLRAAQPRRGPRRRQRRGRPEVPGRTQSVYDDQHDATQNVPASDRRIGPAEAAGSRCPAGRRCVAESNPAVGIGATPLSLFQAGEQALRDRDTADRHCKLFRQAYTLRDQLDPRTAQRLQDHLQLLSASPGVRQAGAQDAARRARRPSSNWRSSSFTTKSPRQQEAARKITEKDPKQALEILDEARQMVEAAGVDSDAKGQMLRLIGHEQGRRRQVHPGQQGADWS